MLVVEFAISTATAMEAFGKRLAAVFPNGGILFLQGGLGAGKTTLTRGFLHGLGYVGNVKSPTYGLVETYQLVNRYVHHFDLYRLQDPEELEFMGIRDYFSSDTVCLIEWPERCITSLPPADLICMITFQQNARKIRLQGNSEIGTTILRCLQNENC